MLKAVRHAGLRTGLLPLGQGVARQRGSRRDPSVVIRGRVFRFVVSSIPGRQAAADDVALCGPVRASSSGHSLSRKGCLVTGAATIIIMPADVKSNHAGGRCRRVRPAIFLLTFNSRKIIRPLVVKMSDGSFIVSRALRKMSLFQLVSAPQQGGPPQEKYPGGGVSAGGRTSLVVPGKNPARDMLGRLELRGISGE